MIFLTVGYMMPFDRLVRLVDAWAGRNPEVEFFAQIGPTDYKPTNLPYVQFVNPEEYMEKARRKGTMMSTAIVRARSKRCLWSTSRWVSWRSLLSAS